MLCNYSILWISYTAFLRFGCAHAIGWIPFQVPAMLESLIDYAGGRGECRSDWDDKNDHASLYFACLLVFSTAIMERIDRTWSLNARVPYPISIPLYSRRVRIWYAEKYLDGEFLNMPIMAWSIWSKVTSRDTFTEPSTQYFRHSTLIRIFEKGKRNYEKYFLAFYI